MDSHVSIVRPSAAVSWTGSAVRFLFAAGARGRGPAYMVEPENTLSNLSVRLLDHVS